MSESEQHRKKSKKKKKKNTNAEGETSQVAINVPSQVQPTKVNVQENSVAASAKDKPSKVAMQPVESASEKTPNLDVNIKEVLPQKVGVTMKFKDVEVTMTSNENESANGTAKKKKKKKKSKQKSNEESEEISNEKEREKLLHFTENHIELVNHPEISVTISNNPAPEIKEPIKSEEKSNKESPNNNETCEKVIAPAVSKKKKKKKKKIAVSENTAPTMPTSAEPNEDSSTPTYVKLPTDGGSVVLLVSHESFSNGSKQEVNKSSNDAQNKPATVLLKKKEEKDICSQPMKNDVEKNSSVSIFPVFSDGINNKKGNTPEFNVNKSLGKISDMMKTENDNSVRNGMVSEENGQNITDTAVDDTKTKAQLKAERRAIQEAQRAAKLSSKNLENNATKNSNLNEENKKVITSKDQSAVKANSLVKENPSNKDDKKVSVEKEIYRKVQIFSHLPQYKNLLDSTISNSKFRIPPPILELGIHYSDGTICGSNARCVGFLAAVREVIENFKTPKHRTFLKDLESQLTCYLEFLANCRPLSVSIVNAMKVLKHHINHIPENTAEDIAKESLCRSINDFVREEILLAKEAITISSSAKIVNNDTILVFAYSSLVKDVLCKAHDQNKSFRVIVVDSRTKLEGLQMLRQLVKHGLRCCYISINAISTVIKKVTKVVIGAHALLANGYVMSRLGCKILSLVSSANSVPVLVCCETYKFWERSLTDSIVHNELGNPNDLLQISINKEDNLLKWQELSTLHIYNLFYDVTPSELISVVITEKGLVPCTSVPVLLRVKHAGRQE